METLTIGSVPCDESCAQVGQENYAKQARIECRALINQLERTFPYTGPDGTAWLFIKSNPHDFGTYYEVEVKYDTECEAACDWAFLLEASLPERWDEQALQELATHGIFPQ